MSDTATSGDAPVAPAETVSAPSAPAANPAPAAASAAPAPAFGNSRGSGLARGKRASNPATAQTSNANTAPGGYKPTAIQIVTTEREYKNPFAPEPVTAAPAPAAVSHEENPPAASVVAPEATPAARPAPQAEIQAPTPSAPAEIAAEGDIEPAPKAELKILPPEAKSRPAQSWESSSFPGGAAPAKGEGRPGERPIFRTERSRQRDQEATPSGGENRRDFRESREPREPRQPREQREQREPRQRGPRGFEKQPGTVPPIPVEEKKSGGLLGWIKGLFSGEPAAPEKPASSNGERRPEREGREGGGRRHHRGSRGRGQGGGGEHRGQGGHAGERNHHRGGRGHHRGGRGRGGQGGFRGENRGSGDGGGSSPAS